MENIPEAQKSITRALDLAEPEGYLRIFLDEGEPILTLLRQVDEHAAAAAYAAKLLTAPSPSKLIASDPIVVPPQTGLIDPLSSRELEVLALIVTGMTNQGIADQLFITLDTVKRHGTHIYSKLGVDRRSQAIARAQELGLV